MKMEGKIIRQGTCHFCKGDFIVLQPTGGEISVRHREPLCDTFKNNSGEDYLNFHNKNRHARRAAEAVMKKQQRNGGPGAVPKEEKS